MCMLTAAAADGQFSRRIVRETLRARSVKRALFYFCTRDATPPPPPPFSLSSRPVAGGPSPALSRAAPRDPSAGNTVYYYIVIRTLARIVIREHVFSPVPFMINIIVCVRA